MGCFGKIAMISSLPIECGDETVLIFMSTNPYYGKKDMSGVVYAHDIFTPTFLPIFGRYDDYGRIEDVVDSPSVKFIEEFFGEDINSIIEKVDNRAVGRHGSDEISFPKNNDLFPKLTFGLELKSVYDKLASECSFSYKSYGVKDLKSCLSRSGRDMMLSGVRFSDSEGLIQILAERAGEIYVNPIDDLISKVGESDIIDFLSFNNAVCELNSKYFPSNYGSQSQNHPLHYKMLSHYRNIIVQKIGQYDECEEVLKELHSEVRDEKLTDLLNKNSK